MRTTVLLFSVLCAAGCTAPNEDFVAVQEPSFSDGASSGAIGPAFDGGAVPDLAPFVTVPDLDALPDLTPSCGNTLAWVGSGDFAISFRIATGAVVQSTVLYQRAVCDASQDMWAITLEPLGTLVFEIAGVGGYGAAQTKVAVNDSTPHDVVLRRSAGTVVFFIDGAVASMAVALPQSLGNLPPIGVAKNNPCDGQGLKPLAGIVTNVCTDP